MVTPEQSKKIEELQSQGYVWNKQKSISAAGVILEKGEDFWFFGLSGEMEHNPTPLLSITITTLKSKYQQYLELTEKLNCGSMAKDDVWEDHFNEINEAIDYKGYYP